MSAALKKLLLLSLALVLSFTLVFSIGCKEKLPQEEIDQIIAGATAASYDTVSFDMDLPMTVKAEGGSEPGTMTAEMSGTGAIDILNRAMQMTMGMEISVPGTGSQEISAEIYVLEGWMYTGVDIPGVGENWMKIELTEPVWQQQVQVEQFVELLATAVEVDYKGTETVNGVECYVFEIEPNMDTLRDLLLQETSSLGMMDLSGLDVAELYQELSVKEWLAKDSYLLQRTEVEMTMEVSPDDVGATSDDFEKMSIDIKMTTRFYAYNQPFNVVLPPEALDAEEPVPPSTIPEPE
jgi:outer membrane lipoprotein-sorting protein